MKYYFDAIFNCLISLDQYIIHTNLRENTYLVLGHTNIIYIRRIFAYIDNKWQKYTDANLSDASHLMIRYSFSYDYSFLNRSELINLNFSFEDADDQLKTIFDQDCSNIHLIYSILSDLTKSVFPYEIYKFIQDYKLFNHIDNDIKSVNIINNDEIIELNNFKLFLFIEYNPPLQENEYIYIKTASNCKGILWTKYHQDLFGCYIDFGAMIKIDSGYNITIDFDQTNWNANEFNIFYKSF